MTAETKSPSTSYRAKVWYALGLRITAEVCFRIGGRLAGRPLTAQEARDCARPRLWWRWGLDWLACRFDRLGCACHERCYAIVDRFTGAAQETRRGGGAP